MAPWLGADVLPAGVAAAEGSFGAFGIHAPLGLTRRVEHVVVAQLELGRDFHAVGVESVAGARDEFVPDRFVLHEAQRLVGLAAVQVLCLLLQGVAHRVAARVEVEAEPHESHAHLHDFADVHEGVRTHVVVARIDDAAPALHGVHTARL